MKVGHKIHADVEDFTEQNNTRYVPLISFAVLILIGCFVTLEPRTPEAD